MQATKIRIISADDHMDLNVLPPDMFVERFPASMRDRAPRVEREDVAVVEYDLGGYFIQPFSRYAFSAPGCSGMPTFSGCHAVRGSNSARPAWPRTSASLFSSMVLVTV